MRRKRKTEWVSRHTTLTLEQARELDRLSFMARKPLTEVVREGISMVIKKYRRKYPEEQEQNAAQQ